MHKLASGQYDATLRKVASKIEGNLSIALILKKSGLEAQLSKDFRACSSQGAEHDPFAETRSADDSQNRATTERTQIWTRASLLSSKSMHMIYCKDFTELESRVQQHRFSLERVSDSRAPPACRLLVLSGDLIGEYSRGKYQGAVTNQLTARGKAQLNNRMDIMLKLADHDLTTILLFMDGRNSDMKRALDSRKIAPARLEAKVWVAYSRQTSREVQGRQVFGHDTHRETGYLVLPPSGSADKSQPDRASVSELPYVNPFADVCALQIQPCSLLACRRPGVCNWLGNCTVVV